VPRSLGRTGRRASRLLALALTFVAASCALVSPRASAGTYDVKLCLSGSGGLDTIDNASFAIASGCSATTPGVIVSSTPNSAPTGSLTWLLSAPPDTTIHGISARRHFFDTWDSTVNDMRWTVQDSNGHVLDSFVSQQVFPQDGVKLLPGDVDVSYDASGASFVTGTLACLAPSGQVCRSFGLGVSLTGAVATLVDNGAPATPTVGGSLHSGATVSGAQTVTYDTSDKGGGITEVDLLVDGQQVGSVAVSNGGRCQTPYVVKVPCVLFQSGPMTLDTTQLSEGVHTVTVVARDVAGNVSGPDGFSQVEVRNTPVSVAPPALSGAAVVGGRLTTTTGQWDPSPTVFHFTWLRCPASVTSPSGAAGCAPILGALDTSFYAPAGADAGQRIMVKVVAQNTTAPHANPVTVFSAPSAIVPAPSGPPHGGPPPGADRTPPALSALSLSRTRFRAPAKGTASLLRLTTSEAARLTVAIERALPGKQAKRAGRTVCTAVRTPVKRGRCTIYKRATTLTASIAAGHAGVALSGRVGARKLAPGAYRVTVAARDAAGNASAARRLAFTVLR
jgi:Bacterial Ig domain